MASLDNQSGTSSSSELDSSANLSFMEIYSHTPSSADFIVTAPDITGTGNRNGNGNGNNGNGGNADGNGEQPDSDQEEANEQGQPLPANGQGQPPPANGQGQPPPANGQGQPPPANGQGQPPPANGQGQPPPANGQGQPPPANGQGQPPPANGQGQPPPANGQGQPPPANGQGQPPPAALEVHTCHFIREGKCFRYNIVPATIILFLVTAGLLILSLVLLAFEVKLSQTYVAPRGAFQAVNLKDVLPRSNLLSQEVCISDENPSPGVTVSLAREKCSKVNTTESYVSIYSNSQEIIEGLLFYWLEDTEFELNVFLDHNSDIHSPLHVRLLKSTKNGNDNFLEECVNFNRVEDPIYEWEFPDESCVDTTDKVTCTVMGNVTESQYYYLCFEGPMDGFSMNIALQQHDCDHMDTCIAPCCMSYSDIFTELDHKASTCMFLVSNLTYVPPDYLTKDATKIHVTSKIGRRWWVVSVFLFFTVVAMITTVVLCVLCIMSTRRETCQTKRICRHVFTCSCYRMNYEVLPGENRQQ